MDIDIITQVFSAVELEVDIWNNSWLEVIILSDIELEALIN